MTKYKKLLMPVLLLLNYSILYAAQDKIDYKIVDKTRDEGFSYPDQLCP